MNLKHNDKFYTFAYEDDENSIYSYRLGIVDKVEDDKLWCRWSSELYIDNLPQTQREFNKYVFEPIEEEPYNIKWLTEMCGLKILEF